LSACNSQTGLLTYRVGTAAGSEIAGRESRPVLAVKELAAITLNLERNCELRVPLANKSKADTITFSVLGLYPGDKERLISELVTGPTWGWRELEFTLPRPAPEKLSLRLSGDDVSQALWGQPLATCPAPTDTLFSATTPATNVIVVSLDTLRADRLRVYGNRRNLTPNLDRLAGQGALFEQAWAPFPNTLAAHASLFTGLTPGQHGLLPGVDARMPRGTRTLAGAFTEQGYHTVAFTENAFVSSAYGFDIGFDSYHNGPEVSENELFPGTGSVTFGKAAAWLKQRPPGPFFMFVHTYEVHAPYTPARDDLTQLLMYRLSPIYEGAFEFTYHPLSEIGHNSGQILLSPIELARIESLYDAETWTVDRQLGGLLDTLNDLGLADSTLLVVTSDHGDEFSEHGYMGHGETLHTQALQVPLIFRLPGRVPAGLRVSAPVGLSDVGPTVASLVGMPPPFANTPARDLTPLLANPLDPAAADQPVFSELSSSMSACRGLDPADFDIWAMANMDCNYDGVALRDERYTYIESAATGARQLFDRRADPGEFRDIAASQADLVAAYHKAVNGYRKRNEEHETHTAPTEIDPITHEKLRALGYMQ
jgi:arylsulfatase A-like enzyme